MNAKRQWIERELSRLKIGQCVEFERTLFEEAYGFNGVYGASIRENFLSSQIGAAWGCWTCELVRIRGRMAYLVGKHQGNREKRVFVDADRAHLYDQKADGSLVLKEKV